MDTHLIPHPARGRILLLVSPGDTLPALFELVARLALQDSLYVLDGGNTFQGYYLARALRRYTADIAAPMQRVLLSRAFTCYQMSALLDEDCFTPGSPSSRPAPILVLDFLSSFYDQGVRITDRRRLLTGCIRRLQILSRRAPVAVWVRQRSTVPEEALPFLEIVKNAAGQVWAPPRPDALPAPRQAELFSL
jgi:hypothetical protein